MVLIMQITGSIVLEILKTMVSIFIIVLLVVFVDRQLGTNLSGYFEEIAALALFLLLVSITFLFNLIDFIVNFILELLESIGIDFNFRLSLSGLLFNFQLIIIDSITLLSGVLLLFGLGEDTTSGDLGGSSGKGGGGSCSYL